RPGRGGAPRHHPRAADRFVRRRGGGGGRRVWCSGRSGAPAPDLRRLNRPQESNGPMRPDGRAPDQLRPHSFERDFTAYAQGSVLVTFGDTKVLCTAMVDEDVPRWMRNTGKGWVTAEYSMLPGSSPERIRRETKGPKGRTQEIQRLIGRALRSVTDMEALGERQILIDCDVLQADGGTRTAAISGAYLALHDCCTLLVQAGMLDSVPLLDHLAAISVGVVNGVPCLDLPYVEDVSAETDMNVVMT